MVGPLCSYKPSELFPDSEINQENSRYISRRGKLGMERGGERNLTLSGS